MNQTCKGANDRQHVFDVVPNNDYRSLDKEVSEDLNYYFGAHVPEEAVEEAVVNIRKLVYRRLAELYELSGFRILFKFDLDKATRRSRAF